MDPLLSINLLICGIAKLKVIVLFSSSLQSATMGGHGNVPWDVRSGMHHARDSWGTIQSFQNKICDPFNPSP